MKLKNLIDGVGSLIGEKLLRSGSFRSLKKKRTKIMSDKEALEYDAKMIESDWKKVVRW